MNIEETVGATSRIVDNGELDGCATHIVRVSRKYSTNPSEIWNAITQKDHLVRWFGAVSGDLKLHGEYSILHNASGIILECDPENAFIISWVIGDMKSQLKLTLENAASGAVLTLEHEHPMQENSKEHWGKYGPCATGVGWEMALYGLELYISANGQSILSAGQDWAESPQGKTTLRAWATAWGEADIKSGTSAAIALDMAKRTGDFYTEEQS